MTDLKHIRLALAPMAGFTDRPFRRICAECGAEYTVTEMVSAQALTHHDRKTGRLLRLEPGDPPTAVQLFGSDPSAIGRATEILLCEMFPERGPRPAAVDINMGCPVRKICSNGEGSALMRDPSLCARIVRAASAAASPHGVPVTVKIRAGWDASHINAPEVALAVAEAGAGAVAVHARTREQMYRPGILPEVIAAVREAVGDAVPVFGNGDIASPEDAEAMLRTTGCSGLLIGRAALGNPWIFRQLSSPDGFAPPDRKERIETALRLLREVTAEADNETAGVISCRARVGHFIRSMRGSAAIRERINRAVTLSEAESVLRDALSLQP